MRFIDRTGKRFGRLVVLHRDYNKGNRVAWLCECDCGNFIRVQSGNMVSGQTNSCGCLNSETTSKRNETHGLTKVFPKEYGIWKRMKQRCYNPNASYYEYYGGRGYYHLSFLVG